MSVLQVAGKEFKILDNVPAEYTALSDAISRLFYVCGSQKLCGACFRGELVDYGYRYRTQKEAPAVYHDIEVKKLAPSKTSWKSRGCCGSCSNLSSTGCVQKPLGCAAWQCPYSSMLLPERVSNFLTGRFGPNAQPSWNRVGTIRQPIYLSRWLSKKLSQEGDWPRNLFSFFRIEGFHKIPLNPNDLRLLSIAAKRVNRIADWLERTGLNNPNWPVMEKITHAPKGVLHGTSI